MYTGHLKERPTVDGAPVRYGRYLAGADNPQFYRQLALQ